MTKSKPVPVYGILPVLMFLVLAFSGAWAQSDSASRPPAPAAPRPTSKPTIKRAGLAAAHSDSSYVIGADDVLAISVWKEPDVSRSVPVRSDGKISLPLVGELMAGGQTPLQLEQEITKRLASYISEPEVTVIVQDSRASGSTFWAWSYGRAPICSRDRQRFWMRSPWRAALRTSPNKRRFTFCARTPTEPRSGFLLTTKK